MTQITITTNNGHKAKVILPTLNKLNSQTHKKRGFIGKPLDSECFYGYHDQCRRCNCTCHIERNDGSFIEGIK